MNNGPNLLSLSITQMQGGDCYRFFSETPFSSSLVAILITEGPRRAPHCDLDDSATHFVRGRAHSVGQNLVGLFLANNAVPQLSKTCSTRLKCFKTVFDSIMWTI